MPVPTCSLRPARPEDLRVLLPWVGTAELTRLWGGPALPFPGSPEATWAAMGGSAQTTFALVDLAGTLVGFGQVQPRAWGGHLARLLVAPYQRGQGLGRILCQLLVQQAEASLQPELITLNVYAENTPALALYRSLGFEVLPPEPSADPASLRMVLRPATNDFEIRRDDLREPEVQALLAEHLRGMHAISPPESVHALDLSGLRDPGLTVWTVWEAAELLGCGALKELDPTHGEVKSMRTASAHLRRGVAQALLGFLIQEARLRGYRRLSLETGAQAAFEPAHRLYARFGFEPCPPFADYADDPNSIFMTHQLW